LMHEGLRETADYWIFEKRFTFKLLQTFYNSTVADYSMQVKDGGVGGAFDLYSDVFIRALTM